VTELLPIAVFMLLLFGLPLGVPLLLWLWRGPARDRNVRYTRGRCTECGYDIRANAQRCSECGSDLFHQGMAYWRQRFLGDVSASVPAARRSAKFAKTRRTPRKTK
jgi:hypothetical protein